MVIAIIILALIWCMVFEIPLWSIMLALIGIVALVCLVSWLGEKQVDRVQRAELIEEIAVYKKKAEHTGFSINYGQHISGRDYYRYKNEYSHHECRFRVWYIGGGVGEIVCRKDDHVYGRLIRKSE